jgi:hypothetical protein
MPYDLNWHDDDHTILRIDIYGEVAWDAYHQAMDQVADVLAKTSNRIDLIFNDKVGLPPGNPVPHIRTSLMKLAQYPHMGLAITVHNRKVFAFIQPIIDTLIQLAKLDETHYGGFLSTLDEAIALITHDRAKQRCHS